MSTIDSAEIIVDALENNGQYPGDPPVNHFIYQYTNDWDGRAFKLIYSMTGDPGHVALLLEEFFSSPFCRDRILLWSKEKGLTPEGEALIKEVREG